MIIVICVGYRPNVTTHWVTTVYFRRMALWHAEHRWTQEGLQFLKQKVANCLEKCAEIWFFCPEKSTILWGLSMDGASCHEITCMSCWPELQGVCLWWITLIQGPGTKCFQSFGTTYIHPYHLLESNQIWHSNPSKEEKRQWPYMFYMYGHNMPLLFIW